MKKAILLFILCVFLTSVFAIAVHAASNNLVTGALEKFGSILELILGGVFVAIAKKPDIWLRMLLFVGIFAVLFKVLQYADKHQQIFDKKTAGILAFVLSFATASITPTNWLIFALSMWSGIIIAAIIAIPAILLLVFSIDCLHGEKVKWRILAAIVMWLFYIALVSTIAVWVTSTAQRALGPTNMWDVMETAVILQGVVEIIMIVGIISIILLGLSLLLGTEEGRATVTTTGKAIGKGLFKKRSFLGRLGKGLQNRIGILSERTEDLQVTLESAKANAKESRKKICQAEIKGASNLIVSISDRNISDLKAGITKIKELGGSGAEYKKLAIEARTIDTDLSNALETLVAATSSIKDDDKTDWNLVAKKIEDATGIITKLNTLATKELELITTLEEQEKKEE